MKKRIILSAIFNLRQLYVLSVEFGNNFRGPAVVEKAEFLSEIDFVHRNLTSFASLNSYYPPDSICHVDYKHSHLREQFFSLT